jgi:3-isopropylmalate/(R)-2-methylmalate dehydratase large subunit
MSATIAEKILAQKAGLKSTKAGDIVIAKVDFAMVHDARAPNAIRMVDKLGGGE